MPYNRRLTALTILTALMTGSAIAGAEVPQSRVAPPHEVRMNPLQYSAQEDPASDEQALKAALPAWRKTAEYRSARRSRTAGIVLLSVSAAALPLGGVWLASSGSGSSGMSGWADMIGTGFLAVGGLSLLIGLPLLVNGVTAKPPAAMPAVQVGSRSASLVWSF
jgi:hypothetical protein